MASALYQRLYSNQLMDLVGTAQNHTIDASNDGVGWVMQAYNAEPITHVGFRYGARNGTPPTYSIALETVDAATGAPTGTDIGGGSPTAVNFTPPADTSIDGLWQWVALTNAYTPAAGDVFAGMIRSGTTDAVNYSTFTRQMSSISTFGGFPYQVTLTGGTYTKSANANFAYRTASGRYGRIIQASYTTNTAGTSGHQSLMHFTLPSTHGSTFQVRGFSGVINCGLTNCKAVLLNTSGTVLQEFDIDVDQDSTSGTAGFEYLFSTATLATLSYGTKYYIGLQSGGGGVGVRGVQLASADDRVAYPHGANRGLVTYNGSYTEDNTVMPLLDLILEDITVPSGGGGGPLIVGRLVQ